jgi:arginine/lysine/ornithine decarboxylase
MKTPIVDFVKKYAEKNPVRFHMPGHKGIRQLGPEPYDITEIPGADTLYSADGIIAESEENAKRLFGTARTFYSAEGSTLAIKAMLALAVNGQKNAKVLAARGVHKSFIYAAGLLDIDVKWVFGITRHLCSTVLTAEDVALALDAEKEVCAFYITSPDYLGNIADIKGISEVCHTRGIPLLVDNAHGAYLAFLSPSQHPIALGADMCCDSAHKTLPVLTGGAYLHISKNAGRDYISLAQSLLSVFASTSPSYLILESLDLCNAYIDGGYRERLSALVNKVNGVKKSLCESGYSVVESEPLKIVINANEYGYTGDAVAEHLRKDNIEAEFFDGEYLVLMVSEQNSDLDFELLEKSLSALERKAPIANQKIQYSPSVKTCMSIREAMFRTRRSVPVREALGKICASPTVSCPPAVPIAVSGELITEEAIKLFERYGIKYVEVVEGNC